MAWRLLLALPCAPDLKTRNADTPLSSCTAGSSSESGMLSTTSSHTSIVGERNGAPGPTGLVGWRCVCASQKTYKQQSCVSARSAVAGCARSGVVSIRSTGRSSPRERHSRISPSPSLSLFPSRPLSLSPSFPLALFLFRPLSLACSLAPYLRTHHRRLSKVLPTCHLALR